MTKLIFILRLSIMAGLLVAGGCLLPACTMTVKNQSEFGVRYGTEVTFFSRAAQTAPEPGTATVTIDDRLMPGEEPKVGDE